LRDKDARQMEYYKEEPNECFFLPTKRSAFGCEPPKELD